MLTETSIDLTSGLGGRYGHLIVVVHTPPSLLGLFFPNRNEPVIQSWVQATNIGLYADPRSGGDGSLGDRGGHWRAADRCCSHAGAERPTGHDRR